MTDMQTQPLTFSDDQLLAALKAAPPEVRNAVVIVAMQLELQERRAKDEPDG